MITNKIFDAITIVASASKESVPIDIPHHVEGFFSLQIEVTGSGTAKFEYENSNDGKTYVLQTADIIVSGFTATSGPGADGKDLIGSSDFDPEPCTNLKIKCTETGGANPITVTATILIR